MATSPLQPVPDSKGIAQMGYDDGAQQYHVQFRAGGPVYIYKGVPPDIAQTVGESESKGKAIQALLVGQYEFDKVDPQEEGEA